jgi:hypothetical protein
MIHDKSLFEEKLCVLMETIQNESSRKIKSDATIVSLKCILDGVMIRGFLLESGNI